jgi:hypothetical protein
MSRGEVNSFIVNYPDMKNKHVNYRKYQILGELEFLKINFICIKWGKSSINGTRATFIKGNSKDVELKINMLIKELRCKIEDE